MFQQGRYVWGYEKSVQRNDALLVTASISWNLTFALLRFSPISLLYFNNVTISILQQLPPVTEICNGLWICFHCS